MRIAIASHIVIDTLSLGSGPASQSLGGPPFYCGLIAKRFKFDVSLLTTVGADLPPDALERLSGLGLSPADITTVNSPTTRFSIREAEGGREMTVLAKCPPIEPDQASSIDPDCWLVSPVADEVPYKTLEAIKAKGGNGSLIMLDPQGYLRVISPETGIVSLAEKMDLPLDRIRAIKVDEQELALISGTTGLEGMRRLQARGIEHIISTETRTIKLLHRDTLYRIGLGRIQTPDATGAGDILASSFTCSLVKERDPLWALCFGAGAVRAALETKKVGLDKIPAMSKIEQNASYFYNTVKFEQV